MLLHVLWNSTRIYLTVQYTSIRPQRHADFALHAIYNGTVDLKKVPEYFPQKNYLERDNKVNNNKALSKLRPKHKIFLNRNQQWIHSCMCLM